MSTKIGTHKTVIRPIILYGSETWTLTGKIASTLIAWERKILREIYGPKREQRSVGNKKQCGTIKCI
jgi:hypothetical protein